MYKVFFFCFIALFQLTSLCSAPLQLSICAIFHNEERFLKDWIDFHLVMGVQRFYLYNHQSTDGFMEVLDPYIKKGRVKLTDWDYSYNCVEEWNTIQCNAYNDCLARYGSSSDWIGFFDIDEYVYSPKKVKLRKILKKFKRFAQVSANWVFYGTSDIYTLNPQVPLIFQLVYRTAEGVDRHVKSFVQPTKVSHFYNPHFAVLKEGELQVTENLVPFAGPFSPQKSVRKLRINHYWTKDRQFFEEEKVRRQEAWANTSNFVIPDVSHLSKKYDNGICEVFNKLKK